MVVTRVFPSIDETSGNTTAGLSARFLGYKYYDETSDSGDGEVFSLEPNRGNQVYGAHSTEVYTDDMLDTQPNIVAPSDGSEVQRFLDGLCVRSGNVDVMVSDEFDYGPSPRNGARTAWAMQLEVANGNTVDSPPTVNGEAELGSADLP